MYFQLQSLNNLYKKEIDKIKNQLNNVLSFVDLAYLEVLLKIHDLLKNEEIEWALGGEIGEALQTVQVEPDCIEIVTNKGGAEKIFAAMKKFNPRAIDLQTIPLLRNAIISGTELPIYVRSFFFDFFIDCVKIEVYGDMQYKINDFDWGDKLEFTPDYVNVTGVKIAVVPLEVKQEIFLKLGWTERSEKIESLLKRRKRKNA